MIFNNNNNNNHSKKDYSSIKYVRNVIILLAIICNQLYVNAVDDNNKVVNKMDSFKRNVANLHKKVKRNTNVQFFSEKLFLVERYKLKSNKSILCNVTGEELYKLCNRVLEPDYDSYHKAINETKKLILDRLNLNKEPNVDVNQQNAHFLNSIQNLSQGMMPKAAKSQLNNIKSIMRKIEIVTKCDQIDFNLPKKPFSNLICIKFNIPVENLYKYTINNQKFIDKNTSVFIWLHFNFTSTTKQQAIRLSTLQNYKIVDKNTTANITNGWNKIDITKLISNLNFDKLKLNSTISETIILGCLIKNCLAIEILNDRTKIKHTILYLNTSGNNKPLLLLNEQESGVGEYTSEKRIRRDASEEILRNEIVNESPPNLCQINQINETTECCLVSYYVAFSALKWSKWILNPNGYLANFCVGKCRNPRNFANGTNGEIKQLFNKQYKDSQYQLSACCHPTNMSSLTINHMMPNGTLTRSTIPNMIITACGCS